MLLKHLLYDYERQNRPVLNETEPLVLTFGITLQQIIDVVSHHSVVPVNITSNVNHFQDEKNQILITCLWLNLVRKLIFLSYSGIVQLCDQNKNVIDVTDSILIKAKPHQTKVIIIFNWNNVILTAICILIQIDGVCSMMVYADVLLMRVLKVWEDYQLNWNASEYGGIDSIRIHPRLIWTPDLLMYNRSGTWQIIWFYGSYL